MIRSPFEVLGVSPGCEPEVVDAAFRAMMKKYHPDRQLGSATDAKQRAQEINAAYAAIKAGVGNTTPQSNIEPDPFEYADVAIAPPFNTKRRLGWTVGAWLAILAALTVIATSR